MISDDILEQRKRIDNLQASAQKNLDSRLSGLRFRTMSGTDFDAEEAHSINQVTFVVRKDENDNTVVELYKGDSKIGSMGGAAGMRGPLRAGGEVIAINHCVIYGYYGNNDA